MQGSEAAGARPSGGTVASPSNRGWMEGVVYLPAGYRTTRRDLLKSASLGGAFASLYVGISRAQVCHNRSKVDSAVLGCCRSRLSSSSNSGSTRLPSAA